MTPRARSAERTETELLALEAHVLGGDAKLEGALRVTKMDILLRRYEHVLTTLLARFPDVELTAAR